MTEKVSNEQIISPELAKKYTSRVLLHFNRHGAKTKDFGDGSNEAQVLTSKGKQQGLEKGRDLGPATPTAVAFGSNIKRSQEMGGFIMAGAESRDDITGEETLDELRAKLDRDLKVGTRLAVDPRLAFHYDSEAMLKATDEAYDRGEGLKWFVENSDEFVQEKGNDKDSSYSRVSADFVKILQKYIKIAPRFDILVNDEEKMDRYGDTLERFMGSHAGAVDFFLCKLIEKIKGPEERDRLVRMLGNQAFDYAEGFDIEIQMVDNEPRLNVSYERKGKEDEEDFVFNESIPLDTLNDIVSDGEITKTGKR